MIAAKPIQRTGPVLLVDCWICEGIGKQNCPTCKGTGKVTRDIHPFGTLEALVENLNTVRAHVIAGDHQNALRRCSVVEDYASSVLQQLILLLPEEWERTEGSPDDER